MYPPFFFHLLGHLYRVKLHERVEVRKADNQQNVQYHAERCRMAQVCNDPFRDAIPSPKACNGWREYKQRQREDDGNNARSIHFKRNVRGLSAEHFTSDYAFSVLNRDLTNSLLNENDTGNQRDNDDENDQHLKNIKEQRISGIGKLRLVNLADTCRNRSDNTREDDNGNTISNAIFGDLFP